LSKLNKISYFVSLLSKIFLTILILMIIIVVAVGIGVTLNADFFSQVIEDTGSSYTVSHIQEMSVTAVVGFALGAIVVYYVGRLFSNIHRTNTPFTDDSVKFLEMIAILMVVGAFVIPIVSYATSFALEAEYNQSVGVNLFAVFAAFLIYFMSLVFKYGAMLQKESDEML